MSLLKFIVVVGWMDDGEKGREGDASLIYDQATERLSHQMGEWDGSWDEGRLAHEAQDDLMDWGLDTDESIRASHLHGLTNQRC